MTLYFWFSKKQQKMNIRIALDLGQLPVPRRCKLDTGEIVGYTAKINLGGRVPSALWDDFVYLGTGKEL